MRMGEKKAYRGDHSKTTYVRENVRKRKESEEIETKEGEVKVRVRERGN